MHRHVFAAHGDAANGTFVARLLLLLECLLVTDAEVAESAGVVCPAGFAGLQCNGSSL